MVRNPILFTFGLGVAVLIVVPHSLSAEMTNVSATAAVYDVPLGLPRKQLGLKHDESAISFGEILFSSRELSRDQSMSCRSCHDEPNSLSGDEATPTGLGGAPGTRHAPALFNLGVEKELMWDGRAKGLSTQPWLPLENEKEMAIDWTDALPRVAQMPAARKYMAAHHQKSLSATDIVSAVAAYAGSLVSGNSAFDKFYFGGNDRAITDKAKEGLELFLRKAQCSTCHLLTGEAAPFTDGNFHSTGVGFSNGRYSDEGRYLATREERDVGTFKTPTLRNISHRHYFMHDGSVTSLRAVIDYYNRGGNRDAQNLDPRIQPLNLSGGEIDALVEFLASLDAPIVSYRLRSEARSPLYKPRLLTPGLRGH